MSFIRVAGVGYRSGLGKCEYTIYHVLPDNANTSYLCEQNLNREQFASITYLHAHTHTPGGRLWFPAKEWVGEYAVNKCVWVCDTYGIG